ncbi:methionyl aminopeptidase [Dacryopinax primogenitus]|uniref:Methionine aminopeptidase n=1 Tax=Dacryopinax primogenitus (strain DJM 731) TaxID=1858805 RepID=M5GH46_DACPD|nr:methionyl aminopeptidase [Dacryopinax primogenitus]EJU06603.1 methionyl aminopeptidase [Dacryopinax primogenitus]
MILLPKPPYKQGVKHIPVRPVPGLTLKPPYVGNEEGYEPRPEDDGFVSVSSEEQGVRAAAVLAKKTLQKARELVKPGLTTDELDAKLHEFICSHGAYPSPLAYHGFPKSICTSVNNVIAHGIPDARPLEDGDIVNVDVTVFLHGWHGDTSATFLVGNVDPRGRELVRAAEDALEAGIKACRHGQHFRNIGASIEECIRERYPGMRVNRQFSGHGIGMVFHRPPWILHHDNDEPGRMSQGMCFTIEPCIVDDEDARGWLWPDGWTVSTETGARSAQAEHMVLIREDGIEVLTR